MRIIILLITFWITWAQIKDTFRITVYNLLNYGGSGNTTTKNDYLKVIWGYINPAIIGVNEVANNALYSQNILINALKPLNSAWEKATYSNYSQSNLTNMLFYRSDLFGIVYEKAIATTVRDLNIYVLYYKKGRDAAGDTIFFTIALVHLKAGNTSADAQKRQQLLQVLLDNVRQLPQRYRKYFILMGDLNLYSDAESAYQFIKTYASDATLQLRDPAQQEGNWSNNPNFAWVHTQSTRTSDLGDGGSTGGLNDRFDFILANPQFWDTQGTITIVPSSYRVVGQDGQHFQKSLIDPPANLSVPSNVLNALYANSDHLPVVCDFVINATLTHQTLPEEESYRLYKNQHRWCLEFPVPSDVVLYNVVGQRVWQARQILKACLPLHLEGIYLLQIQQNGHTRWKRLLLY